MKLPRRRWDVGEVPYPKAYGRCVKACISEGRSRRVLTLEANLALQRQGLYLLLTDTASSPPILSIPVTCVDRGDGVDEVYS